MDKLYLVGKSLSSGIRLLKEKGLEWRVISEDGNHCAVTDDFKDERYNLTVVKDKITKTTFG